MIFSSFFALVEPSSEPHMLLLLGVVLGVVVILVIALVLPSSKSPQQFRVGDTIKYAPPEVDGVIPLIGCLPAIISQRGLGPFLKHIRKVHGEIVTMSITKANKSLYIFGFKITLLFSKKGLDHFFQEEEEKFNFAEGARMFLEPMMGKQMVNEAIPVAPLILNSARRALNMGQIRSTFTMLVENIGGYFEKHWKQSDTPTEIELSEALHDCLTQNTCKLMFEMDSTEIGALYSELERGLGLVAVFLPWLPLPSNLARFKARDRIIQIITETIEKRSREGAASTKYRDLLQILSDTKLADGSPLPSRLIPFGIINVLLAATTSTPVVDTWTLVYLLQNPKLMAEMVAEQDAITASYRAAGRTQLDLEDAKKMDKLHAAIKETIRFTSATLIQRRVMVDTHYDERYVIPMGHYLCVSPHVIHSDPSIYTNPELYDPSRFYPERDEGKGLEYFLGFGRGRHQCAGEQIAFLQSKVLFHYLLTNYTFRFVSKTIPSPNPDQPLAVLKPMQPIVVSHARRQQVDKVLID